MSPPDRSNDQAGTTSRFVLDAEQRARLRIVIDQARRRQIRAQDRSASRRAVPSWRDQAAEAVEALMEHEAELRAAIIEAAA